MTDKTSNNVTEEITSGNCIGTPITFRFTGRVISASSSNPAIVPGVGTLFSGSFTFDPSVTDTNPDPSIGIYSMPAPFGFTVSFQGGGTIGSFAGLRIRVRNNIGGVEDDYEVQPDPQRSDFELRFLMRTRNTATLNSDALLLSPPRIQDFSDVHAPVLEIDQIIGTAIGALALEEVDSLTIGPP
jgi:hypothetical protein